MIISRKMVESLNKLIKTQKQLIEAQNDLIKTKDVVIESLKRISKLGGTLSDEW